MSEDNVIPYPDKEFVLRCKYCKVNSFYIILNSEDPYDFKYYECTECGRIWSPHLDPDQKGPKTPS